jgi:hypothetical protein
VAFSALTPAACLVAVTFPDGATALIAANAFVNRRAVRRVAVRGV